MITTVFLNISCYFAEALKTASKVKYMTYAKLVLNLINNVLFF